MLSFDMIFPNASEQFKNKWSWVDLSDPQFTDALNKIVNTRQNLVIMGPGGTGKSILLQMAADALGPEHTAVLSSTGISAANLSGNGIISSTIHSFFNLKPLDYFVRPSTSHNVADVLEHTENILIDEVSMVNASLMECILHTLEINSRFGKEPPRLILFGDILQLLPVIRNDVNVKEFFKKNFNGQYLFFNSGRFQQGLFEVIHLKRIYRQKAESWQNVLNRVRMGTFTPEDLDIINSRVCDERRFIRDHEFMMYLTPLNRRVDTINSFYYDDDDDANSEVFTGTLTGNFRLQDNPYLSEEVRISKGMQVMCLRNNWMCGYQNGTLGIVEDFNYAENGKVNGIIIKKKDGTHACVQMEKWEQYDYQVNEQTQDIYPVVTGSFIQIGCKPAFACTIHKSQGLTLDSVYGEFNGGFAKGLVYVGLSRCTSLEGLGLKYPVRKKDIATSKEALKFLESGTTFTGFDLF